jgi:hypothetical protein
MRAFLQFAFAVNVALFFWHEILLAWLVRRRLGFKNFGWGALPYPIGPGVRDDLDDLVGRGGADGRLASAWRICDAIRRWSALVFVGTFIVVYAQARWPIYWFLLKGQWQVLLTGAA